MSYSSTNLNTDFTLLIKRHLKQTSDRIALLRKLSTKKNPAARVKAMNDRNGLR
jgi:hypothetical protein